MTNLWALVAYLIAIEGIVAAVLVVPAYTGDPKVARAYKEALRLLWRDMGRRCFGRYWDRDPLGVLSLVWRPSTYVGVTFTYLVCVPLIALGAAAAGIVLCEQQIATIAATASVVHLFMPIVAWCLATEAPVRTAPPTPYGTGSP